MSLGTARRRSRNCNVSSSISCLYSTAECGRELSLYKVPKISLKACISLLVCRSPLYVQLGSPSSQVQICPIYFFVHTNMNAFFFLWKFWYQWKMGWGSNSQKAEFLKTDHNNINCSLHDGIFISQSNSNFLNPTVSAWSSLQLHPIRFFLNSDILHNYEAISRL